MRSFLFVAGVLALVLGLFVTGAAMAQDGDFSVFENMAHYYKIEGDGIDDGDVVSLVDDKYVLSSTAFDRDLFGIVNLEPAVGLKDTAGNNMKPVVTNGTVRVNVSSAGGNIEIGDWVTSSDKPGIAMKATRPGLALGTAMEAYSSSNADETGKIRVALAIRYVTALDGQEIQERSLSEVAQDLLRTGAATIVNEPNTWLKYLIAALVVLFSILFGFMVFGRSAIQGIVAIGRNPLARNSILLAVSFNIFLTVVFAAVGLAAAFFILAT